MFEVNNGVAKIDGSRGKYDGGKYESKVSDPSVRYGRCCSVINSPGSRIEIPGGHSATTSAEVNPLAVIIA